MISPFRIITIVRANSREAFTSLRTARLRTILGLIGITIGISSVIAMISIGEIAKDQARKQFEELGTNILVIRKGFNTTTAEQQAAELQLKESMELADSLPSIVDAAARISEWGRLRHAGVEIKQGGTIQGVTRSFAKVNQLPIISGRFISDLDINRNFCVVGYDIALAMREAGTLKIEGSIVEMEDNLYTVIGVLGFVEESYALPVNVQANTSVFVPITTAARFESASPIDVVIARTSLDAGHEAVTAELKDYFKSRNPDLVLDVVSAKQLIQQMESQMQLFTTLLAAIGSISLIVGGIGIMNIMLVSVTERRREIAIRRALGARQSDIQSQFLIESVILTMVGGLMGIVFGLIATFVVCRFTGWDYLISSISVVSGLVTATLAGLLFGFQPARQASRLDPITGLQSGS